MSPIEHVISAAKSIAINGHTPSVALIKARVGKIPMPIIVQGLQQFKALPKSEWQTIADFVAPQNEVEATESPLLEAIMKHQQLMQQQINELLQRVALLEQQLNDKAL